MPCFSTWAAVFFKANSEKLFLLKSGPLLSTVAVDLFDFLGTVRVHHAFIKSGGADNALIIFDFVEKFS